ncbi:MAG: hypothetical protein GQ564_23070 [Bacteroidales bacterium]|nr:hypothetical protein [Bacteroidales bacterium]
MQKGKSELQILLSEGYSSIKTTEIYTHVVSKSLDEIKTSLDLLYLNKKIE